MESSVTSQISPKVYSGEISKLHKEDIDAQSELFEINIFNSTLHIAPGKSISDEENDKLVYFYVYAIKDDKVVANLGVYELLTDEQKLLYDISSFENLLLFDYYYTNPNKIKDFEIIGKNNIFDYIKTHLEYIPIDKALLIYNNFARFRKDQKESIGSEQHQSIFKKIIGILSKDIKTKGIDDEKINQLKENTTTVESLKLTLAILEPFLNVQFSFIDKGESVDNYRNKTPAQEFTPKQYIIVSTDQSFVSTSRTLTPGKDKESGLEAGPEAKDEAGPDAGDEAGPDAGPEAGDEAGPDAGDEAGVEGTKPNKSKFADVGEIKEDLDNEPESKASKPEGVSGPKPAKKMERVVFKKLKPVAESESLTPSAGEVSEVTQGSTFKFLGRRIPELKSKAEAKESKEGKEVKESKTPAFGSFFKKAKQPESKAEVEPAESKAQSKSGFSLFKPKKDSKAESKAEAKAVSKAEAKAVSKAVSKAEAKPEESEPTNLEAVGIFNKNYKSAESKKPKPSPSRVKSSAPRRQSAKFVENVEESPAPKASTAKASTAKPSTPKPSTAKPSKESKK